MPPSAPSVSSRRPFRFVLRRTTPARPPDPTVSAFHLGRRVRHRTWRIFVGFASCDVRPSSTSFPSARAHVSSFPTPAHPSSSSSSPSSSSSSSSVVAVQAPEAKTHPFGRCTSLRTGTWGEGGRVRRRKRGVSASFAFHRTQPGLLCRIIRLQPCFQRFLARHPSISIHQLSFILCPPSRCPALAPHPFRADLHTHRLGLSPMFGLEDENARIQPHPGDGRPFRRWEVSIAATKE